MKTTRNALNSFQLNSSSSLLFIFQVFLFTRVTKLPLNITSLKILRFLHGDSLDLRNEHGLRFFFVI